MIMFYIDLWRFFIDPPYLGYNSANRKHVFCVFLYFRDLLELK
jgi:hypothetical protein